MLLEFHIKDVTKIDEMQKKIEWIVTENSYCMLEVVCSTTQIFEPKSAVKNYKMEAYILHH